MIFKTKNAKTLISNPLESHFSESTERIDEKSISFESYFKAQHS